MKDETSQGWVFRDYVLTLIDKMRVNKQYEVTMGLIVIRELLLGC